MGDRHIMLARHWIVFGEGLFTETAEITVAGENRPHLMIGLRAPDPFPHFPRRTVFPGFPGFGRAVLPMLVLDPVFLIAVNNAHSHRRSEARQFKRV